MQNSSVANNITKTVKSCCTTSGSKLHILYDGAVSLFDDLLDSLDYLNIFPLMAEDKRKYTDFIGYDLFLSNNPVWASSNISQLLSFHLNIVVFFHSTCPNNFKKEDKFLLKNSLKYVHKIFSSDIVMSSWGFDTTDDRSYTIDYGIRKLPINQPKNIDICILNINSNPSVKMLYNYIKNVYPNTILVDNSNYTNIYETLLKSKICIEAESEFNIYSAIAHKCYVISSMKSLSCEGLINIPSYDNIQKAINSILSNYNEDMTILNSDSILKKYSLDEFAMSFEKILRNIIKEPYIYAKNI